MTSNDANQSADAAPSRGRESFIIFISHDSRDSALAEAFSKLLSSVSAGVLKSFRSSDRAGTQGIEYGVEWFPEIMRNLERATDVVCLLTERSINRPWILYEAGVARGKLSTPVHGLALGVPLSRASTGPFAQFQNCDDDVDSITKLVVQLLRRIPGSDPDYEAVAMQVTSFKERVGKLLGQLPGPSGETKPASSVNDTAVAKLFEEIKVMFQDLPSRVEGQIVQAVEPSGRRRSRRLNPMVLREVLTHGFEFVDPALAWLMVISLFRDDVPWAYEVGMRVYRALEFGRSSEIERATTAFRRAAEFALRSPQELGLSRDTHIVLHEAAYFLDRLPRRLQTPEIVAAEAPARPAGPESKASES